MRDGDTRRRPYTSHKPDASGRVAWSDDEHAVWSALLARQLQCIEGKACDAFLEGLEKLDLPPDHIPQLPDLNAILQQATGWRLAPVPALISFDSFFRLLADRAFPVATFLRRREDFDYLQEPDLFHEIFGHCPMLTHPDFAEFTHTYGRQAYAASAEDRVFLARLYWFTVEFGLLGTGKDCRIYGGGILSSPGETTHVFNGTPEIQEFDLLDVLRTPYRIDIMQPLYYRIPDIRTLFDLSAQDLLAPVRKAKQLGLFPPRFPLQNRPDESPTRGISHEQIEGSDLPRLQH